MCYYIHIYVHLMTTATTKHYKELEWRQRLRTISKMSKIHAANTHVHKYVYTFIPTYICIYTPTWARNMHNQINTYLYICICTYMKYNPKTWAQPKQIFMNELKIPISSVTHPDYPRTCAVSMQTSKTNSFMRSLSLLPENVHLNSLLGQPKIYE